jgi:hypothetical protein
LTADADRPGVEGEQVEERGAVRGGDNNVERRDVESPFTGDWISFDDQ